MKKIFTLLIILSTTLSVGETYAQHNEFEVLERTINAAVQKSYSASVRIAQYDTLLKQIIPAYFSGVVVSKDGHILTAAHAVQTDKSYIVIFPDGRKVLTKTLGRIDLKHLNTKHDLAMLKIDEPGVWPVAQLGWSSSLKVNEPCISISYPGNLNQSLPSIRFGRIAEIANSDGLIRSTCKMEPGDSGGPLFDYMGRVIGIHNGCGIDEDNNFENPIDLFKKYWSALNKAEDYKEIPDELNEIGVDSLTNSIISLPYIEYLNHALPRFTPELSGACVKIVSHIRGRQVNAAGTLIRKESKNFILSKSSLIGNDPQIVLQDIKLSIGIVARDTSNDLILMKLDGRMKQGIPFDLIIEEPRALDMQSLGRLLVTSLPGNRKTGIISSLYLDLPRLFSSGYLGLNASFDDEKVVINAIGPNSAAALGNLKVGDQIKAINEKQLSNLKELSDEIRKYNPGDTITIESVRADTLTSGRIFLTRWPVGRHAAEHFAGGRSDRADGFKKVFAYDANIRSDQCGSPVFDLNGNFYGINIARFSRTTTLVIPADIIWKFISNYL